MFGVDLYEEIADIVEKALGDSFDDLQNNDVRAHLSDAFREVFKGPERYLGLRVIDL